MKPDAGADVASDAHSPGSAAPAASLAERVAALEREVTAIRARNQRVEEEKAWEQSKTRTCAVLLLTYLVMCLLFWAIGAEGVFRNALIPVAAYYLSIQSLPLIKQRWLSKRAAARQSLL